MVAAFCFVIAVFGGVFCVMTNKPLGVIGSIILFTIGMVLCGPHGSDEISQNGYDYINASPVKVQYVKEHNLMADGKITRDEFFSMPKNKTPKEITLEKITNDN
jgi:hypothetical protein